MKVNNFHFKCSNAKNLHQSMLYPHCYSKLETLYIWDVQKWRNSTPSKFNLHNYWKSKIYTLNMQNSRICTKNMFYPHCYSIAIISILNTENWMVAPKTWRICTQTLFNPHCYLKLKILHFKRWKEKNFTQNTFNPKCYLKVHNFNF